jgi:hypothetical protein
MVKRRQESPSVGKFRPIAVQQQLGWLWLALHSHRPLAVLWKNPEVIIGCHNEGLRLDCKFE